MDVMNRIVRRVILAYKRRMVRKLKRRSPLSRIKQRMYYKTHKAKIRLQRRRYMNKNRIFLKSRKLFKRTRPTWLAPKKHKQPKPKIHKKPAKRFKPRGVHPKKAPKRRPTIYVPKRRKHDE